MSARQTLDQQRAKHAWEVIQKAKAASRDSQKEFAQQAKAMPTRIMNSGLGTAVAFVMSKKKAPELVSALADWIPARLGRGGQGGSASGEALIREITGSDSLFLRRATAEALAYLQWINRFADAEGLSSDEQ